MFAKATNNRMGITSFLKQYKLSGNLHYNPRDLEKIWKKFDLPKSEVTDHLISILFLFSGTILQTVKINILCSENGEFVFLQNRKSKRLSEITDHLWKRKTIEWCQSRRRRGRASNRDWEAILVLDTGLKLSSTFSTIFDENIPVQTCNLQALWI